MSLRALGWLRRLVGLYPKPKARTLSGEEQAFVAALDDVTERLQEFTARMNARRDKRHQEQVPPVIKAPSWLVQRMAELKAATPPTLEEVEAQMKASAKLSRCYDQGMSYDEAKQFALDHSNDILASLNAPWRKKVGDNCYEGSCGCVFDAEGNRVKWCGDHY
jgi:hypothetical protein